MAGKKNRSGRITNKEKALREAKELYGIDAKAVDVLEAFLDKGDRSVAMFVYEQNHGKAKQAIESINVTLSVDLTPGEVKEYLQSIKEAEFELLNSVPSIECKVSDDTTYQ